MAKPRILAIYLPQFHPLPENDEWWGKGFTEWTNVGKAKPLFHGHDQPRVPTELGYYDLRLKEVREQQAQMAKESGVEGFLYWHYWFGNGKTLMADIFNDVVKSGKPDFPICIGWANHSWYAKSWNGSEVTSKKLLIEQTYPGEQDARMFFDSLLPAFKDNRYIKVNGKPVMFIFNPNEVPDLYLNLFEKWAKEEGFPGMYFIANVARNIDPKEQYLSRGFNAVAYERFLGGLRKDGTIKGGIWGSRFIKLCRKIKGAILHRPPFMVDYRTAAQSFCTDRERERDVIPMIMPQWDHTPRSGWTGTLLVNAKPEYFKEVVAEAIDCVKNKPEGEGIILLKSWNEWGEGNYIEPDLTNGRRFLNAMKEALEESENSQP